MGILLCIIDKSVSFHEFFSDFGDNLIGYTAGFYVALHIAVILLDVFEEYEHIRGGCLTELNVQPVDESFFSDDGSVIRHLFHIEGLEQCLRHTVIRGDIRSIYAREG